MINDTQNLDDSEADTNNKSILKNNIITENEIDIEGVKLLKCNKRIKEFRKLNPDYASSRSQLKILKSYIESRVRLDSVKTKILSDDFYDRIVEKDKEKMDFILINPTPTFRKGDKSQLFRLQLSDNYRKTIFDEYVVKNKNLARKNYHMSLLEEEMKI